MGRLNWFHLLRPWRPREQSSEINCEVSETNWAIDELLFTRRARRVVCGGPLSLWVNENWWNQFKCSAKRERTPTNTHHTNAFLHWWKKRAESEWNPINGVKGRESWRGWLPSFLGARARSKKRRAINKSPPRRLSGRVGLSFLCGLRAGPPAIAPHKEDKHSPATLPFNKFILSFFFFLARRAWTVLVVGYGWGPALCRGRTQSNWFHQFPLSSLPSFVSLKKKERVDWLINKRKDEREWNDCLWDESWRAIQP